MTMEQKTAGGFTLPEHRRVHLDPAFDVAGSDLSPVAKMVARAAQQHGFIVAEGPRTGWLVRKRHGLWEVLPPTALWTGAPIHVWCYMGVHDPETAHLWIGGLAATMSQARAWAGDLTEFHRYIGKWSSKRGESRWTLGNTAQVVDDLFRPVEQPLASQPGGWR